MRSKVVNLIVFCTVLAFSIFFGIENYRKNKSFASQDAMFDINLSQATSSLIKSIADDINIAMKNKMANNSGFTSSSPNAGESEVSFTNFHQMYEYAIKKLNRASYVYSTGTGSAKINGSAPDLGLAITDASPSISFIKAKALDQRYFNYKLSGKFLDSLGTTDIRSLHYTDGTVYKYNINKDAPISLSKSNYESRLNWNMTSPFHLPNETALSQVKDSEIIAFYFDESTKEYVAKLSLDTSTFKTNLSNILTGIANASTPASFSKIELTIRVDSKGNLKTITYNETFSANLIYRDIRINGNVKTSYTETFDIIDNGTVEIKNPF